MRRLLPLLTLACVALAAPTAVGARKPVLRVMSYNLYQGSELIHSISAPSISALPAAVAQDWADVQSSNFPARAAVIASEIKAANPDVVGLSEAALWRTQAPSNLSKPATNVAYDYVDILLQALRGVGASYRVVAIVNNFNLQAPGSFPSGSMDIRLTDRVAIIARKGVKTAHVKTANYAATASITAAGIKFVIPDGYAATDVRIGGKTIRFVATHLDALTESVRTAQAGELVRGPTRKRSPLVLVGDFNGMSTSAAYRELTGSGLKDSWLQAYPSLPGLTCCHNPYDLVSDMPPFNERIDYVFERGLRPQSLTIAGLGGPDRTPSGMRPSDHAGLVATLRLR